MVIELTEAEHIRLLAVLDQYREDQAEASCDEVDLPDTPGNRAMIEAAWNRMEPDEPFEPCTYKGKIVAGDGMITAYLRWIVEGKPE